MSIRQGLKLYNTLSGEKELFEPQYPERVGMYVCGPTLYSEPHMGNMRTFINFDMIYRYLLHLGYQVKYVRNITDAGHITNSAGDTDDQIGKAARLQQVQSLEIVYQFNLRFQHLNRVYNLLPPSIEPTATQHIQEQIEVIEEIIANGLAYVENGSVYFDVQAYAEKFDYGVLSGRKLDELESETRALNAQAEKRFFADFALWKKANPDDMQIWRSPWGDGNPGWHIECTAMSRKYLGSKFDIHGGGMDLKFPHHEDEIAQSCGSTGHAPCRYWLHANMLNVNGQKMSKSLGNYFLPMEILEGSTELFTRPFSASTVRFLMMQAHYRSTMDISQEALEAAEKGWMRIQDAITVLNKITAAKESSWSVEDWSNRCYAAMNDDFNTPLLIAQLFDAVKKINSTWSGHETLNAADLSRLKSEMKSWTQDVLGIPLEESKVDDRLSPVMDLLMELRQTARANKDWSMSDQIRDGLSRAGIIVKDGKDGTTWE